MSPTVAAFEQELENILLRFTKKGNPGGDIYSVADNARKRSVASNNKEINQILILKNLVPLCINSI